MCSTHTAQWGIKMYTWLMTRNAYYYDFVDSCKFYACTKSARLKSLRIKIKNSPHDKILIPKMEEKFYYEFFCLIYVVDCTTLWAVRCNNYYFNLKIMFTDTITSIIMIIFRSQFIDFLPYKVKRTELWNKMLLLLHFVILDQ
jgi:hypothetical protein